MPRRKRKPTYRKHSTGQAFVVIDGKRVYLGKYDSPESLAKYRSLTAEWDSEDQVESQLREVRNQLMLLDGPERVDLLSRIVPESPSEPVHAASEPEDELTIDQLAIAFIRHAKSYYRKDGQETSEVYNITLALRPLIRLFGTSNAKAFGPKRLKKVRAAMIMAGCVRTSINRQVDRVRRMFKWAASEELLSASVHAQLMTVAGLRKGRAVVVDEEVFEVCESEPVKPVSHEDIGAVQPFVSRQVWAMIELQRLTGMRPGEVRCLRPIDIDRSEQPWIYQPTRHKKEHFDHDRIVPLGPKAQQVLMPFLIDCLWEWEFRRRDDQSLFSPADARREFDIRRKMNRKSKVPPSQRNRRKANPARTPGEEYTDNSYYRAIQRACEKAGVERWHPNQIRHTAGTDFRSTDGIEVAQVMLGHSSLSTTQVYAERDLEKAKRTAMQRG